MGGVLSTGGIVPVGVGDSTGGGNGVGVLVRIGIGVDVGALVGVTAGLGVTEVIGVGAGEMGRGGGAVPVGISKVYMRELPAESVACTLKVSLDTTDTFGMSQRYIGELPVTGSGVKSVPLVE